MAKASDDPCYAAHMAALKCLDDNNYVKESCIQAFDAFKACRAQIEEGNSKKRHEMLKQASAVCIR